MQRRMINDLNVTQMFLTFHFFFFGSLSSLHWSLVTGGALKAWRTGLLWTGHANAAKCDVRADHTCEHQCPINSVLHHCIFPSNTLVISPLLVPMDFQYRWQDISSSSSPPTVFCCTIYTPTMTRKKILNGAHSHRPVKQNAMKLVQYSNEAALIRATRSSDLQGGTRATPPLSKARGWLE